MTHLYPIFTLDAARAYEDSVLRGEPSRIAGAMENAGQAVSEALHADYRELREWPAQPRLLILAGKGFNTGDALVTCERLHATVPGLQALVVMTVAEADLHPLTATVLQRARAAMGGALRTVAAAEFLAAPPAPFDVVLDGLFGHGFHPPLPEPVAALLDCVNSRRDIDLRASIDLPSGVGASTDPRAFQADFTYIPGVAKAPCFDRANRQFTGRVRFLEIAPFLDQPLAEDQVWHVASAAAHKSLGRLRPAASHKRHYGHVLVLAGSVPMPGAALMSTMGALHAGAGLVTTLAPIDLTINLAGQVPEAMWWPIPVLPDGCIDGATVRALSRMAPRAHSLLVGPGLIPEKHTAFTVCRIVREITLPTVLDAAALSQDALMAKIGRPLNAGPVIITPHQGEFARLIGLGEDPADPKNLLALSRRYRVFTVLKGNPTLVCDGRRIIAVPVGGPALARGGSGDVLAGMVATLLAQNPQHPLEAAIAAVAWHGAAGDALARANGHRAVTTTDMLDHLAPALRA